MTLIKRRSLLTGLVGLIAAPAIVRVESLMPLRGLVMQVPTQVQTVEFIDASVYGEDLFILSSSRYTL